ncbi:MAG: hypothetical protein JW697_07180 [Kosmotogaceae bacterium]|nr:hypothetical protein [Kosmotogaceae bacterium]
MAESPAHKFGQIIGNLLEEIIHPFLKKFSDEKGYYLDKAGKRGKARAGRKVTWKDKFGNDHDLDFVLEEGGTEDVRGRPVAFIEAAWRRYTKHSRNKAQEIQGALLPIAENYSWDLPFLGAVIAGVFTEGSIKQLESVGFTVLYFPYDTITAAFVSVGIDTSFDESTPDEDFKSCVDSIEALSGGERNKLKDKLVELNREAIEVFISKLGGVLSRSIAKVLVCPLYGNSSEFSTVDDAILFLGGDFSVPKADDFRKIEIVVVYTNGDKIEGSFISTKQAVDFLEYAKK